MKLVVIFLTCHIMLIGKIGMAGDTARMKVGIFVTNLYDFNISGKSYKTDFWIWYLTKSDSVKTLGSCFCPAGVFAIHAYMQQVFPRNPGVEEIYQL